MSALPAEPSPPLDGAEVTRPRLRADIPILWRTQDSIQLGEDVIVDAVSREHVNWLVSLDGLRSVTECLGDERLPAAECRRLLRAALAAGALDDAARIPDPMRWARPEERDRHAARFAASLDQVRDIDEALAIARRRDRCRVRIVGSGPLAEAMDAAVATGGLVRDDDHPSVTVLADAPHPDVTAHLDHELPDGPHLHVGARGRRAVIGPLVLPGVTGCLRCTHLHRRDADAAWPLLAVQWAQAGRPSADPVVVGLAALHALLLVRRLVDEPEDHPSYAGFALDLRLPVATPLISPRPAHPLCGCRWAAA